MSASGRPRSMKAGRAARLLAHTRTSSGGIGQEPGAPGFYLVARNVTTGRIHRNQMIAREGLQGCGRVEQTGAPNWVIKTAGRIAHLEKDVEGQGFNGTRVATFPIHRKNEQRLLL